MKRRRGLTLVEVLVALTLVAIQVPAVVATVASAAALTRRAQQVVAAIDPATAALRCEAP
ncbi:MAG: prepilin-type N-terminal cleavage/methylation domain-containing protein [Trueperaceae bacterium]